MSLPWDRNRNVWFVLYYLFVLFWTQFPEIWFSNIQGSWQQLQISKSAVACGVIWALLLGRPSILLLMKLLHSLKVSESWQAEGRWLELQLRRHHAWLESADSVIQQFLVISYDLVRPKSLPKNTREAHQVFIFEIQRWYVCLCLFTPKNPQIPETKHVLAGCCCTQACLS